MRGETAAGIENGYTLKLANKTDHAQRYRISASAPDVPALRMREADLATVPAGSVASLPLTLVAPAGTGGRHAVTVVVKAEDGTIERRVDSSFFGPM